MRAAIFSFSAMAAHGLLPVCVQPCDDFEMILKLRSGRQFAHLLHFAANGLDEMLHRYGLFALGREKSAGGHGVAYIAAGELELTREKWKIDVVAQRGRRWKHSAPDALAVCGIGRSEERRVGKEGRSRWSPYH